MSEKKIIIIGGGPAGLTAAYELANVNGILPIVLEQSPFWGGISRTEVQNGNRMDIGGHRFFSKSDVVMQWWQHIMPVCKEIEACADKRDVLLVRHRKSRIYYHKHFFDYPVSLNYTTIKNLGWFNTFLIGLSYLKTKIFPPKNIQSLEDFFISRFGNRLYRTFFKDYTEKVWGVSCKDIPAEWGKQRIKGLSITKTLLHAFKKMFTKKSDNVAQKDVETSLIEYFLYPKYGPGQMWELVADKIAEKGGVLKQNYRVTGLNFDHNRITSVEAINGVTGKKEIFEADYVISTMPVKNLIESFNREVPPAVQQLANSLQYRDFITVGLLLDELQQDLDDNWIYIQENYVKLGRLQIFNNWSPYMVKNPEHTWVGLEYFCAEGDELWSLNEQEMIDLATDEMIRLGFIKNKNAVLDSKVIKVPKAYPAYFGSYEQFDQIRTYTDAIENLYLVGRNGMHKYNNQDHSMLTAMAAVEHITGTKQDKNHIWHINTEETYHEEK